MSPKIEQKQAIERAAEGAKETFVDVLQKMKETFVALENIQKPKE